MPAEPDPGHNFLYIFDASGSMAKKIGDRTKFNIAKQVIIDHINELPADVGVGLLYFGSQSKGKKEINYAVPIDINNREEIAEIITGLSSGGLTPLAESLQISVEEMDKSKKDATIVLITDGKEECGGDPIKVINDFAEKGRIIELHIIGLGVDKKTKLELEKIASIGGGYFYDANDAFQLKDSLSAITVTKMNEQILKLKSSQSSAKTSKRLYTLKKGEKIKVRIKFKPEDPLDAEPDKEPAIYFILGDTQVVLKNVSGSWTLYLDENGPLSPLIWPTGLNINYDSWNYMSFVCMDGLIELEINMKKIFSMEQPPADIPFKVGVEGGKTSFKDLTTEIPLY
ncbi:MAG: VWA domain-containing protein [Elusimicrobia bacterium]|nr:VWA domain-containing protein [Elusimicrobiota bacterium]